MKPRVECGICLLKWTYERSKFEGMKAEILLEPLIRELQKELKPTSNLGKLNNIAVHKAYELLSFKSPYFASFKEKSNKNAKKLIPAAKKFVEEGVDGKEKLKRALKIACEANVSPIEGPKAPYTFSGVEEIIKQKKDVSLDEKIIEKLLNSRQVLYIPDNAGEIGFDSLLIKILHEMGKKVVLCVKKSPFFDDATMEDAEYFKVQNSLAEIIELEGFLVPQELKPPLKEWFDSSDLIISKGMGSYEALGEEGLPIPAIYMFKVKCNPISEITSLALGEMRIIMEA